MIGTLLLSCLVVTVAASAAEVPTENLAEESYKYGPFQNLKTEPSFRAVSLDITKTRAGLDTFSSEAHLFVTLRTFDKHVWGPQVFDSDGTLVFYSGRETSSIARHDPHVCAYKGEHVATHLCVGNVVSEYSGHLDVIPTVYDNSYTLVSPTEEDGVKKPPKVDGHEFRMIDFGKSFLSTRYVPKRANLAHLPGGATIKEPWVLDACFQEVDTKTRKVLFNWCYLDHFQVEETTDELTHEKYKRLPVGHDMPFDFAHINSVDKDKDGDYLISLQHLNQLIKVAGKNNIYGIAAGTGMWRLGGKSNNFRFASSGVPFISQHDARFYTAQDYAPGTEIISLFDNHCMIHQRSSCKDPSSAKLLLLDHNTHSAHLMKNFEHPTGKNSWDGGSMESLENGNIFVSWGQVPEVSEFNATTGQMLVHTNIGQSADNFLYRSSLAKWRGFPAWQPKVLPYLMRCSPEVGGAASSQVDLHLYMSWNGATQAKKWRVSASLTGEEGSFEEVGVYERTGFETHARIACNAHVGKDTASACAMPWWVVTAVDSGGRWLPHSKSDPVHLFIPSQDAIAQGVCTATGCEAGYEYTDWQNQLALCNMPSPQSWHKLVPTHVGPSLALMLFFTAGIFYIFAKFIIGVIRNPDQFKESLRRLSRVDSRAVGATMRRMSRMGSISFHQTMRRMSRSDGGRNSNVRDEHEEDRERWTAELGDTGYRDELLSPKTRLM